MLFIYFLNATKVLKIFKQFWTILGTHFQQLNKFKKLSLQVSSLFYHGDCQKIDP
jgi:hypothetical protein